jgi:outer membrane protein OmpA-like peptidoglycan-associated protein
MKNMSSFKKSVLSIVFMSAVTGSFISWDKYQPRHETQRLVEFYQDRNLFDHFVSIENTHSLQDQTLAMIQEENALLEAELIAQTLAENMFAMEAEAIYRENLINSETYLLSTQEDNNIQAFAISQADNQTNNLPVVKELQVSVSNDVLDKDEISKTVISEKILFAFDSSEIADGYLPLLNETAIRMQDDTVEESKIWQVVGYADLQGNNIYNSRLAEKRAQAVTEYLLDKGVDEDKLIVLSLGESQSASRLPNHENNRLDRRVEIHDYQELITNLSKQFDAQINMEKANHEKHEGYLKKQLLAHQEMLGQFEESNTKHSDGDKQNDSKEPENKFELSQQQKEKITTVMKL